MPTKYSPRIQRPPSPYRSSQSPRPKSQQRIWRSLSGTGESDSSHAFAEKSREMWLRSLRRGGDTKNAASYKANVSSPALSGTSDHLRAQLGLPNSRRHKRNGSVDFGTNSSFSPSAMQHKSKEDLCDEIISLKKMLVSQKNDYEVLKTKTRRLEEENSRNSKFIEELLDKKTSSEKVRMLAEGSSRSSGSVNTGLKLKILKLEKRLGDKENELLDMKRQVKMTDAVEMKTAMEMYYQEVLRLQDLIKSEKLETTRLNSSMSSIHAGSSTKQGELRKKIVQLVAENNKLTEENRRLRIDMDRALDYSEYKFSDDENIEGEEIKFSALSKTELVGLIKKSKSSELHKMEQAKKEHEEKTEKFKSIISNLKEEKNEVKTENEKLNQECDQLNKDLENQIKKVTGLRREIEELEKKTGLSHNEKPRQRRRSMQQEQHTPQADNTKYSDRSSDSETPRARRRKSQSRRPATPNTRNKAALSIQKHWHDHKNRKSQENDIVTLQAALKGHIARSRSLKEGMGESFDESSRHHRRNPTESDEEYTSTDDVVYLQSAIRGHNERSS